MKKSVAHVFSVENYLYVTRLMIGVVLCYLLFIFIPQMPFQWSLVSVVVAISPDNSTQLAKDRMVANLLGCAVGFVMFFIHPPNLLMLSIRVLLVVIIGLYFNMQGSIRSALAAIVVLMLYNNQSADWTLALNRLICVIAGCLVALLVTLAFNYIFKICRIKPISSKNQSAEM